jgi:hypothetical protein
VSGRREFRSEVYEKFSWSFAANLWYLVVLFDALFFGLVMVVEL